MARTMSIVAQTLALTTASSNVSYQDVEVGGYVCGFSQRARVYYPTADGTYPLISFAHGYLAGGSIANVGYDELLQDHAQAGYVVISLNSADGPLECADVWKDQIRSLEWMATSELASKVDYSLPTGILGHSMGGGATYHSASQADAVQQYNIGVAVSSHPQIRKRVPIYPITNPLIPIMFTTGSTDLIVPDKGVKEAYDQVTGVSKIFVDPKGFTHFEPSSLGKNRLNMYMVAMFDCHIKEQSSQCDKVYGASSDSLCVTSSIDMKDCEHANAPLLAQLV